MPRYDYMNSDGEVIERVYSMTNYPQQIRCKGRLYKLCVGVAVKTSAPSCWPQKSWSVGVHPSQIKEAYAESVRNGVPTDFAPNGDRIFRDRKHRADWCRANNNFDRSAGYGDACRK